MVSTLIVECELLIEKELKNKTGEFHSISLLKEIWLHYSLKLT